MGYVAHDEVASSSGLVNAELFDQLRIVQTSARNADVVKNVSDKLSIYILLMYWYKLKGTGPLIKLNIVEYMKHK